MARAGRDRRAARGGARHRWDELFPGALPPTPGLLEPTDPDPPAGDAEDGPPQRDSQPEDCEGALPRRRLLLSARLVVLLCAIGAAAGGAWWWSSRTASPSVHSVGSGTAEAAEAGGPVPADRTAPGRPTVGAAATDSDLVVHVAGAVASPGVIRLPRGSRIHEAIAAAGGALPDADAHRLNLAAPVEDGSRLQVPRSGEEPDPAPASGTGAAAGTHAGSGAASAPAAKVNINQATAQELGTLPRVGPVLAQRIIDYRTAHGRFRSPEDLDAVDGVGPKMLESLLPLVTVG
ncbi:ComEA family DNA-binding protein [Sinomonas flava]|uniref:Helix-hairpin-helix DNA-binding motif class 1 domain-containing protein n=1 Tax=Sinomonas flava TaxID=496857 RepID=A0ABN3BL99_9MICC